MHTFEEGQGSTGGIMDYGDGSLDGEFQFNTKYRKAEVCAELSQQINKGCKHIVPHTVACGNGVVEEGEDCECTIGQQACTHCDKCQLAPNTVCSPDGFSGSECCSPTGRLMLGHTTSAAAAAATAARFRFPFPFLFGGGARSG
jgi:hypothetical protein